MTQANTENATDAIRDFTINIPQAQLDDLAARLANARLPEAEPVADWSQGIPLSYVQKFLDHWRDHYDWRRCEAAINAYPQQVTTIDGVDLHFLHIRSPQATARPLIMTHGWPGSIIEFMEVIGPLTDPVRHGGKPDEAFHLVLPSLPGYGFSGKPATTGWAIEKIASAWDVLMQRLGYNRYLAQGGDWGAMVTSAIGVQNRGACAGIHVNLAVVGAPSPDMLASLTPEEQAALAHFAKYQTMGAGYAEIQRTRPQTLGYGLADSPVGQMAWIIEKFHGWADEGSLPHENFGIDRLLDNVMLYWLTNSGSSSARLYWESFAKPNVEPITMPGAVSIFPHEIVQPSQRWVEQRFRDMRYYGRPAAGGHFAAMEVPELFIAEVRAAFAAMAL